MSTVASYAYYDAFKETPKRYLNLGVLCCCIAGFVFFIGIILMVILSHIKVTIQSNNNHVFI